MFKKIIHQLFHKKNNTGVSHPVVDREVSSKIPMMLVYEDGDESFYETSHVPDNELAWGKSVCPYCGVGCGLLVGTKDGKVLKTRGDKEHPANLGMICAKGVTLPQMLYTADRTTTPLYRDNRENDFSVVSWSDTLPMIAKKMKDCIQKNGADSVAFYISGQLLTEDYYVINKFAKGFLGTNNVDSNSRLCMSSAVAGYSASLGVDGPPACYEDIEKTDCFFLIGTNTAACHPVTFQRIKNRKTANFSQVKVIVADPRRTKTAEIADLYIPLRPGTDVALVNGMLHVLKQENLLDEKFIQEHTSGWAEFEKIIDAYTPEFVSKICDIDAQIVREAALLFGQSASSLSLWSMGLNQSSHGVAKNTSVINLHLATGKIGKPGSGPFSLTGQPNAMGGRESGGLSHLLPGHRLINNPKHRTQMENLWNIASGSIAEKPGFHAVDLFKAMEAGKVKIVFIIATNPMVSMPNLRQIQRALDKAELVICLDPYHPTESTQVAHIILPVAQWSERDGTVTNSERRISYLNKIADAPGEAWPDWKIIAEIAKAMGFEKQFSFASAAEVFEEYKTCLKNTDIDISGMSFESLKQKPTQWPYATQNGPTTPRLYTNHIFPTADGRAKFLANKYEEAQEMPNTIFPMILTTGRVRDQWHTMTRTGKIDSLLASEPYSFVEIHPEDAEKLGIEDGDMTEIISRRGATKAPAKITSQIRQGCCFMPIHWGSLMGEAAVNDTTIEAHDPVSKQPELKFCSVRIQKTKKVMAHSQ